MLELRAIADDELPTRRAELARRMAEVRIRTMWADPGTALDQAREVVDSAADRSRQYDVVDDGRVVGFLWWYRQREEANVNAADLEEPARMPELVPALMDLARADGVHAVGCAGVPGDEARMALVASEGFVARATNMALALDGEIGDPGELELRPMTPTAFEAYLASSIESYIAELAAAGMSPQAAREQGERQMAELIPDGLDSPGQNFFTGWVGDTAVGRLWISTERPLAFVYDVEVDAGRRRKGFGEAIMNAGARWCRDLGHPALGLNVFAHNPHARALYDKLGYHVTVDYRTIAVPDAG